MTPADTRFSMVAGSDVRLRGQRAPRIALRVEKLVLEGVRPGDRYRVAEAFQRELSRLIGERMPDALVRSSGVAMLDAGQFTVSPGMTPETTGTEIARAVFSTMSTPADAPSRRNT